MELNDSTRKGLDKEIEVVTLSCVFCGEKFPPLKSSTQQRLLESHIKVCEKHPLSKAIHFNRLTPAEDERLALLLEELGEAVQIVGKIQRHGYESFHPDRPHTKNRELLEKELGHVRHAMIRLCESMDLSKAKIHWYADRKSEDVEQYLHHQ